MLAGVGGDPARAPSRRDSVVWGTSATSRSVRGLLSAPDPAVRVLPVRYVRAHTNDGNDHSQRDHLSGDSSGASGVMHLPGRQSVESVGHAVHSAVGSLIALAEGGSRFFALHEGVPVVPARHPGHVSNRHDGRFAVRGPLTRSGDCHVGRAQQVSGTIPHHGCLGAFRREGTQNTSSPDVAGGDKDETERYEQESAWGVRAHQSSLHHSRGDRHVRVGADCRSDLVSVSPCATHEAHVPLREVFEVATQARSSTCSPNMHRVC